MKVLSAIVSGLFVFVGVFIVAGLFLMPHLPPVPDRPVTPFEGRYWIDNWAGAVLGVLFAALSVRSVIRGRKKTEH